MIRVSIPGKIHLIGEHSVVYGKPAILAPINLYLHAKIEASPVKEISGLTRYDDAIKNLQGKIEQKIMEKFGIDKIPDYKLEIDKSEIPVGSGLGTSASLSAAFTICLLKFLNIEYKSQDIFEIALEGEKVFHGNPSGGDLAAVLSKGLIYFKKNSDATNIVARLFMDPRLRGDDVGKFLLIDSGKPTESTAEMVLSLSLRAKRRNLYYTKVFNDQENLVEEMVLVLENGDSKKFLEIIKKAERNLEKLGVVGKNAKTIIRKIENLGGGAKITGAGGIKKGSGMILAFHKDLNKLITFAKENNLKYYSTWI